MFDNKVAMCSVITGSSSTRRYNSKVVSITWQKTSGVIRDCSSPSLSEKFHCLCVGQNSIYSLLLALISTCMFRVFICKLLWGGGGVHPRAYLLLRSKARSCSLSCSLSNTHKHACKHIRTFSLSLCVVWSDNWCWNSPTNENKLFCMALWHDFNSVVSALFKQFFSRSISFEL